MAAPLSTTIKLSKKQELDFMVHVRLQHEVTVEIFFVFTRETKTYGCNLFIYHLRFKQVSCVQDSEVYIGFHAFSRR